MIYHTTGAHENFIERNKLDYKQTITKTVDNVDKKTTTIFKNDTLLHRNLLPQLTMNNQYQNLTDNAHEISGPVVGVISENNVSFIRV